MMMHRVIIRWGGHDAPRKAIPALPPTIVIPTRVLVKCTRQCRLWWILVKYLILLPSTALCRSRLLVLIVAATIVTIVVISIIRHLLHDNRIERPSRRGHASGV